MNTGNGGYYDENMLHANNYTTFPGAFLSTTITPIWTLRQVTQSMIFVGCNYSSMP